MTFAEHTGPVTAVAWAPTGGVLLSASLDGTVKGWDLVRYRPFRTLTTPTPVQFVSLAVDPSGQVLPNPRSKTLALDPDCAIKL